VPPKVQRSLTILFVFALVALLSTLPFFAPTNIFTLTQSRLDIPPGVLFNRLKHIRPLSALEETLHDKFREDFQSHRKDSKLLYLTFGPDIVASCPFCDPSQPNTYFYYALPSLLLPHLLHIILLGLCTSSLVSGAEGSRFRTQATIAGIGLAATEVYMLGSHDIAANATATTLPELDLFFWRLRVWRGLGVALVDGVLGWVLFLTSTNRWLVIPASPAERLEASTKVLEAVHAKMTALGALRNTIMRDHKLRSAVEGYWVKEHQVMGDVLAEPEVLENMNKRLETIDMSTIQNQAGQWTDGIMEGLRPRQGHLQQE